MFYVLKPLQQISLNTQLKYLIGEPYNFNRFIQHVDEMKVEPNIVQHVETGWLFKIPAFDSSYDIINLTRIKEIEKLFKNHVVDWIDVSLSKYMSDNEILQIYRAAQTQQGFCSAIHVIKLIENGKLDMKEAIKERTPELNTPLTKILQMNSEIEFSNFNSNEKMIIRGVNFETLDTQKGSLGYFTLMHRDANGHLTEIGYVLDNKIKKINRMIDFVNKKMNLKVNKITAFSTLNSKKENSLTALECNIKISFPCKNFSRDIFVNNQSGHIRINPLGGPVSTELPSSVSQLLLKLRASYFKQGKYLINNQLFKEIGHDEEDVLTL